MKRIVTRLIVRKESQRRAHVVDCHDQMVQQIEQALPFQGKCPHVLTLCPILNSPRLLGTRRRRVHAWMVKSGKASVCTWSIIPLSDPQVSAKCFVRPEARTGYGDPPLKIPAVDARPLLNLAPPLEIPDSPNALQGMPIQRNAQKG